MAAVSLVLRRQNARIGGGLLFSGADARFSVLVLRRSNPPRNALIRPSNPPPCARLSLYNVSKYLILLHNFLDGTIVLPQRMTITLK
jgi:hypothetical protein